MDRKQVIVSESLGYSSDDSSPLRLLIETPDYAFTAEQVLDLKRHQHPNAIANMYAYRSSSKGILIDLFRDAPEFEWSRLRVWLIV